MQPEIEKYLALRCTCRHPDHLVQVGVWNWPHDEPPSLYIHTHLADDGNVFHRIATAVRHIFRRSCGFGAWTEVDVSPAEARKLKELLELYLSLCEVDND